MRHWRKKVVPNDFVAPYRKEVLPGGTMSSGEHPGVVDDGATAPPASLQPDEAESHLVGELILNCILSVCYASIDGWFCDPVSRMHRRDLGQEPSGCSGDGQNQNYEDLHTDRCTVNECLASDN